MSFCLNVVCCRVKVSAKGRNLVQRSPTECVCVCVCVCVWVGGCVGVIECDQMQRKTLYIYNW